MGQISEAKADGSFSVMFPVAFEGDNELNPKLCLQFASIQFTKSHKRNKEVVYEKFRVRVKCEPSSATEIHPGNDKSETSLSTSI
jgi:hypothetical protein